jgi:hypothetical protein
MATLHIGNNLTEELVGDLAPLTPEDRRAFGCGAQRLLWFAEDDDILVLPWAPDDAYIRHVTELTGTRRASLRLIVPPTGEFGPDVLSPDRLADQGFRDRVDAAMADQRVDRVFAIYPDAAVASLARSLGVEDALPGHRFLDQGGSALVNSKALFRAVAAGIGIPVATGTVTTARSVAEEALCALLTAGHCVIVKREFGFGGDGNEILSPADGVRPSGAKRAVVLTDQPAVRSYLEQRWDWLTNGGRHEVVIERYHPDALPVYAEFLVSDTGIELTGHGELLMAPLFDGLVIPAPTLAVDALTQLVDSCRRLCEAFHTIGYRGSMSVDAIVTGGQVLLHESNSRVSGGGHLHDVIGKKIVGEKAPGDLGDRIIYERGGWRVSSFQAAVERLVAAGLDYDPVSRTGVILVCDFGPLNGTVRYCVVAEDLESARDRERMLPEL